MVTKQPNSELIDYQFKVMKEGLDSHRDETNRRFDRLEKLITEGFSSLPTIYATKEEHEANKESIKDIQDTHKKIVWSLLGTGGTFLIGFGLFLLKKIGITL